MSDGRLSRGLALFGGQSLLSRLDDTIRRIVGRLDGVPFRAVRTEKFFIVDPKLGVFVSKLRESRCPGRQLACKKLVWVAVLTTRNMSAGSDRSVTSTIFALQRAPEILFPTLRG